MNRRVLIAVVSVALAVVVVLLAVLHPWTGLAGASVSSRAVLHGATPGDGTATAGPGASVGVGGGTPGTSANFTLVGHDPLFNRGMNAALALYGSYVYIGSRTDASTTCGIDSSSNHISGACPHPHPGVLIVDAHDPASPRVVGEIGPPHEGLEGITSRELRVWPEQRLLIVMNFRCSAVLHACLRGDDNAFPFNFAFFDLRDPVHPTFLTSYVPTTHAGGRAKPHEMFLWVDPKHAGRALLYLSTPADTTDPASPNLLIADISRVPQGGAVSEVAEGNWNDRYPGASNRATYGGNLYLHSMGVSADGTRAYLAMLAGALLVLDTSDVAANVAHPVLRLLTDPRDRPTWPNPNGHSAVKVPGRALVLTTDEVYGTFADPHFGCPWGWMRLVSIADEARPVIVGEYRIAEDQRAFCGSAGDDALAQRFTSYSAHNPTVLRDLALITWHSGGLQVVDIADAAHPTQAGWFSPQPLTSVAIEDPALGGGPNKVVMWSYPVLSHGLIYVVDIRNGLYILRFTGAHQDEIAATGFLEGNSNLGDAGRLESP